VKKFKEGKSICVPVKVDILNSVSVLFCHFDCSFGKYSFPPLKYYSRDLIRTFFAQKVVKEKSV
jgi:hypothetical protein